MALANNVGRASSGGHFWISAKNPPLGSTLNFDADVKKPPRVKNASLVWIGDPHRLEAYVGKGQLKREQSSFHVGDARSFLTLASKFNIEPSGGFFDVSPENDRASPM